MTPSESALAALTPRIDQLPARFALELSPGQDSRQVADQVMGRLEQFDPAVAPISEVDHSVLVLDLGARTLEGTDPALCFAAGYALADEFALRTAEPDLPTPFFPEEDPAPPGAAGLEGLRFPPGCWVDAEDGLEPWWALERIHVPQAWAFSEAEGRPARGRGVVIAQIDTGVVLHAELADVPRRGGFNVLDKHPDPTDPLTGASPGHGTATASVVVSPVNLRISGSAPEAMHMPIRAITNVIRINQISVAAAIHRAVDDGAHVITMSRGGIPAAALQSAVRRAVAADVIVMAAAGNCVRAVVWPARYEECLAVGGTDSGDAIWRGSCRGPAVDISAPAQNVYKAGATGPAVDQGQGTSFAVALTAGVAALWLAHRGRAVLVAAARARGETLQDMFRRLLRATARRPAGWDSHNLGAGIVDAAALLRADLDLGLNPGRRELESVAGGRPRTEPEEVVAGLVAETAGIDAVPDTDLDWTRYGPELATVLLHGQLLSPAAGVGEGGPRQEEITDTERAILPISSSLARAIGNPRLRDYLGLDKDLPPFRPDPGTPG